MKIQFNKFIAFFLALIFAVQVFTQPIFATREIAPLANNLAEVNSESKIEEKEEKKTQTLFEFSDQGNLDSSDDLKSFDDIGKNLKKGQSQILTQGKTIYEVGDKIDLSELEILARDYNGDLKYFKYDDLVDNPNVTITPADGEIIEPDFISKLKDRDFLKEESKEVKDYIKKFINDNDLKEKEKSIHYSHKTK